MLIFANLSRTYIMLVGSHTFVVFHCANTENRGQSIQSDNSLGYLKWLGAFSIKKIAILVIVAILVFSWYHQPESHIVKYSIVSQANGQTDIEAQRSEPTYT